MYPIPFKEKAYLHLATKYPEQFNKLIKGNKKLKGWFIGELVKQHKGKPVDIKKHKISTTPA